MGWNYDIVVKAQVNAAQQRVWDRVSDHDATQSWVKRLVRKVTVHSPGRREKNGVEAIRGLKVVGWPEAMERVVLFEAPQRFQYKLISGMPQLNDHLGEISLAPIDNKRCEVTWAVNFDFKPWHPLSWAAPILVPVFKWIFQGGLDQLAEDFAKAA